MEQIKIKELKIDIKTYQNQEIRERNNLYEQLKNRYYKEAQLTTAYLAHVKEKLEKLEKELEDIT